MDQVLAAIEQIAESPRREGETAIPEIGRILFWTHMNVRRFLSRETAKREEETKQEAIRQEVVAIKPEQPLPDDQPVLRPASHVLAARMFDVYWYLFDLNPHQYTLTKERFKAAVEFIESQNVWEEQIVRVFHNLIRHGQHVDWSDIFTPEQFQAALDLRPLRRVIQ